MKRMVELLDKPYPWKVLAIDSESIHYKFNIDDNVHYKVLFMKSDIHTWNLRSILSKKGYEDSDFLTDCFEIHFARFKKVRGRWMDTDRITDTGNEFTIFTTIFEILKHGLNKFNPTYLAIISKVSDPSRVKLYKFFAKELQRKIPYTLIGQKKVDSAYFVDKSTQYTGYYLVQSELLQNNFYMDNR